MDEKLAELIGILLGDGCISTYHCKSGNKGQTQYRIKITLNAIKDLEYSNYVSTLLEHIFKQKPKIYFRKDENTLDIYLLGKQHVDFLLNLGMTLSPKWARAQIPKEFILPPLDKFVVRGYADTDGCICNVNNNGIRYPRIEMKICPSPMQSQFIQILKNNGFEPQINKLERGKIRIALSGMKKLKKWLDLIGFSNKRNITMAEYFIKEIAGGRFELPTFTHALDK